MPLTRPGRPTRAPHSNGKRHCLAEALRQLRKQTFVRAIDEEFALGAHLSACDEKAVPKTVSGLLKILHPHGQWTHGELREYLEFAMEGGCSVARRT